MKKGIIAAMAVIVIAAAGAALYFVGQPADKNETGTEQIASTQQTQLNKDAAAVSLASLQSKDPSKNRTYKKGTDEPNIQTDQTTDENLSGEVQQDTPPRDEQTPADPPQDGQTPADPPQQEQTLSDPPQDEQPPSDQPQQEQPPADPPQQEQTPADPPQQEQTPADPPPEDPQPADPPEDPWQDIDHITRVRAQFILNNFKSFSDTGITEEDAIYYAQIFEHFASQRSYIDAETLMGIAYTESGFDTNAVALNGGEFWGLMQLHYTYESHYGYSEGQLFDPYCNVECACLLLDECAAYYGYDLTKTILAYHWGPIPAIAEGTVDQYYTRDYVYPIADQIRSMY